MSRLRRPDPMPEVRIGNCAECNGYPRTLYKVQGIFRYRCSECFQKETGHRHYQDHEERK